MLGATQNAATGELKPAHVWFVSHVPREGEEHLREIKEQIAEMKHDLGYRSEYVAKYLQREVDALEKNLSAKYEGLN
jgi:hypothetical protein